MHDYNLTFISNSDIYEHVRNTVLQYRFSISLREFTQNIIDPIKLTFDAKVYGKAVKEIIELECIRQIDKSNSNFIGYFHQNIFKYVGNGWEVPEQGWDVVNSQKNIFVELKNKHNTMNSSAAQKTYMKMQNKILRNDQAVCMLVEVIAKSSQNSSWVISLDGEQFSNDRIRRVSVDKFYELVTGDADSFMNLCKMLPMVLDDVIHDVQRGKIENTVYDDLGKFSSDIIKSLFLLSFEKYHGFDSFLA